MDEPPESVKMPLRTALRGRKAHPDHEVPRRVGIECAVRGVEGGRPGADTQRHVVRHLPDTSGDRHGGRAGACARDQDRGGLPEQVSSESRQTDLSNHQEGFSIGHLWLNPVAD